jgi:hypothetical protein
MKDSPIINQDKNITQVIKIDDNLIFIDEKNAFGIVNYPTNAVFVIKSNDLPFIAYQVAKIRNSDKHYLNPLFVICRHQVNLFISNNADGCYWSSEELVEQYYNCTDQIFKKIALQEKLVDTSYDLLITNKILRYIHSRDLKSLTPFLYPNSALGYDYPFVGILFQTNLSNNTDIIAFLKKLEKENYFKSTFVDYVYQCNHCYATHLIYREVCPKCESADVEQKDLIHHFSCAYVGPKDDFTAQNHELICPKCDKRLKHIGVDYDKPSSISTCNTCEHVFQDVKINAKCTNCGHDNEVEKLLKKEISTFQVTSKTYFAAEHGVYAFNVSLDSIQGTVPIDVFKIMLGYEIERLKLAKINSNLACIKLLNATEIFEKLGKDTKIGLWADLIQIIRSTIKKSDILAFDSAYTLLFSLNETAFNDAQEEVRKLAILIKKLIKDNLDGVNVSIHFNVKPIVTHQTFDEQINLLTNE